MGCLHRQLGEEADLTVEHLVTSPSAEQLSAELFVNVDRNYWGIQSGLRQRLDCSGFQDRLRVGHKPAVHILGLFSRVGVALFVAWAKKQSLVRQRTYSKWCQWNCGHRWHMIHQVTQPL